MDLSLILREAPAGLDAMDFGDSLLLLERHYKREHARRKLNAAFHGMELKG